MTKAISPALILCLLAIALPVRSVADLPRSDPMQRPAANDNAGIAIDQIGVLVYPQMMTLNAIFSGEVRVAISVDPQGNLTDYLITAYTNTGFADVVVAALKRWRYHPAKVNGRPVASRTNLQFEFRDQGVIVQTLPGAIVRQAFFNGMGLDEHFAYKPSQLKDLDRIPTPVEVVSPVVVSDDKEHQVTVEFYIDEKGQVRMPAVAREAADDVFAAAAVMAVERWRFEPPMRKGRPVLVLAEQQFNFRPKPQP